MTSFAQYIGLRYDPDSFNCWHLVQRVMREQFDRELPDFDVDASDLRQVAETFHRDAERHSWHTIDQPLHGCYVLMRRSKYAIHIGIWLDIDGGGILHNLEGIGVVYQKPCALQGLTIEGYYTHA